MSGSTYAYENLEGEMVEVDVGECQNFADTITSDMMDFHNEIEKGDFYTVSCCVIENIVAKFREQNMDDDYLLEYMIDFVKQGECH